MGGQVRVAAIYIWLKQKAAPHILYLVRRAPEPARIAETGMFSRALESTASDTPAKWYTNRWGTPEEAIT